MAVEQKNGTEGTHLATAQMRSLPISTKHSIEISRHLRFKSSTAAKTFLEKVITLSEPVPFKRFVRDIGHKKGMASGRFPVKAAKSFLALVKSAEKNAEDIGLDPSSLKIVHLLANKASIPMTGGRTKGATKRTHLEIKVAELAKKEKGKTKKSAPAKAKPAEKPVKKVEKVEEKSVEKVEEKPVEVEKTEPAKPVTEQKTENPTQKTTPNQDTTKGEAQ